MRNWNSGINAIHFFNSIFVYILPMRNWNIDISSKLLICSQCLYLTYEELKHCSCQCFITYRPSLYLTYEELKPIACICYCFRFIEFISYLWGIETKGGANGIQKMQQFISYLWGIETFRTGCYRWSNWKSLYLTYEELKQASSISSSP